MQIVVLQVVLFPHQRSNFTRRPSPDNIGVSVPVYETYEVGTVEREHDRLHPRSDLTDQFE